MVPFHDFMRQCGSRRGQPGSIPWFFPQCGSKRGQHRSKSGQCRSKCGQHVLFYNFIHQCGQLGLEPCLPCWEP